MQVHCLGTTGYHPSPTRHTACYYLPELAIVLDAGTGMFRLVEHLLKRPHSSLDILVSHSHLDHIIGLTFLLDALAVTELKSVRVIGEPEKLDAIRQHLYSPLIFPVQPEFEFIPLPSAVGSMHLGDCRVRYFPLEHPGGSIGYIIEHRGKRLAYITDTVARPDADYVAELTDIDLLLHECYFSDALADFAVTTGHSWLSGVEEIVRLRKPKRTALIHINPLAEVLGNGFELNASHRDLGMFISQDQQTIAV